jgi:multiple sugar transport system permease protein
VRRRRLPSLGGTFLTAFTLATGVVWSFPLYWAACTAFTVDTDTVKRPPDWFPAPPILDSFRFVLANTRIVRWYANSVLTSLVVTVAVVLFTMMAAYPLSQLRFRGRKALLFLFLAAFMIPQTTNLVPLFMFLNRLGLVNSYLGVILPQTVAPIALITVVIYKQFFDQVPRELREAARLDGAGETQILFRIFLPLNWGVTWAMAIVVFIWTWNNFFWPFIIVNSTSMMTIPVGITQVESWYGIAYSRLMASAVLAALPTAVVYVLFHRRVAQGVAMTAGIK